MASRERELHAWGKICSLLLEMSGGILLALQNSTRSILDFHKNVLTLELKIKLIEKLGIDESI